MKDKSATLSISVGRDGMKSILIKGEDEQLVKAWGDITDHLAEQLAAIYKTSTYEEEVILCASLLGLEPTRTDPE